MRKDLMCKEYISAAGIRIKRTVGQFLTIAILPLE
jgi:hypothetical protein